LGVGDLERRVGEELGIPAGTVEDMVMPGADEHEVPDTS
jgi:hypothetical protein